MDGCCVEGKSSNSRRGLENVAAVNAGIWRGFRGGAFSHASPSCFRLRTYTYITLDTLSTGRMFKKESVRAQDTSTICIPTHTSPDSRPAQSPRSNPPPNAPSEPNSSRPTPASNRTSMRSYRRKSSSMSSRSVSYTHLTLPTKRIV